MCDKNLVLSVDKCKKSEFKGMSNKPDKNCDHFTTYRKSMGRSSYSYFECLKCKKTYILTG